MTEQPPPGEPPWQQPPPGEPPWQPPPPGQPPEQQPPPGQAPWQQPPPGGPPRPQSSGALAITMGILVGIVAVGISAVMTFGLAYSGGSLVLAVVGPALLFLILGVALTVPASTRPFGLPYLITSGIGFVVLAGSCVPLFIGGF